MAKKSQTKVNLPVVETSSIFYAKFTNNGNDSLTIDGSSTPVTFTLEELPPTQEFMLERVTFVIESDSNIILSNFASLIKLTNGITFTANGDILDLKAETVIKDNGDILLIATDTTINTIRKSSTEDVGVISGSWDFTESYSGNCPIIIDNDLKIIINDDLSTVAFFKVSCHGIFLN